MISRPSVQLLSSQTKHWIGDNYYYDEDTLRTNSVVVVGSSDRSPFHSIHAIMSLRVHLPARVHASSSGVAAAAQELMDLESWSVMSDDEGQQPVSTYSISSGGCRFSYEIGIWLITLRMESRYSLGRVPPSVVYNNLYVCSHPFLIIVSRIPISNHEIIVMTILLLHQRNSRRKGDLYSI